MILKCFLILVIIIVLLVVPVLIYFSCFNKTETLENSETLNELTIYFPYYNKPEYLQKQLKNYSEMSSEIREKITILIVDDGSMESPAIDVIENFKDKLNIILYRINIDIPWNMSEANNLAFSKIQTDYVFRTDIDIMFLED